MDSKTMIDDMKARGKIGSSVSYNFQRQLEDCETAFEAWMKLKGFFESQEIANIEAYEENFNALKWIPGDSMKLFLGRVEELAKRLDVTELAVSEYRRILKVQKAAPNSWAAYFDSLRASDVYSRDWEKLIALPLVKGKMK